MNFMATVGTMAGILCYATLITPLPSTTTKQDNGSPSNPPTIPVFPLPDHMGPTVSRHCPPPPMSCSIPCQFRTVAGCFICDCGQEMDRAEEIKTFTNAPPHLREDSGLLPSQQVLQVPCTDRMGMKALCSSLYTCMPVAMNNQPQAAFRTTTVSTSSAVSGSDVTPGVPNALIPRAPFAFCQHKVTGKRCRPMTPCEPGSGECRETVGLDGCPICLCRSQLPFAGPMGSNDQLTGNTQFGPTHGVSGMTVLPQNQGTGAKPSCGPLAGSCTGPNCSVRSNPADGCPMCECKQQPNRQN